MIRAKADVPLVIDLNGPDGNAFALIGYAQQLCEQLGRDSLPIEREMISRDYENLISVFEREFGEFVTLLKVKK